jgi:competence protein ComEC
MDSSSRRVALLSLNPLLWIALAFLAGDALAFVLVLPVWLWLSLAALFLILWLLLLRHPRLQTVPNLPRLIVFALAAGALCLGAARYQSTQTSLTPQDLAFYNDDGRRLELLGTVITPPVDRDSYIELRVRVDELQIVPTGENLAVRGSVLARVSEDKDWRYGDRVLLRGLLETPAEFEDFSYRAYLARQGIGSLMPFAEAVRLSSGRGNPLLSALYSLRRQARDLVYRLYPDPEASLLAGILLGDESGLSASLKEDFNDTGARHIIAISGFNITIIAGLLLALFRRFWGPLRGAWLAILGIALYTFLVGADAAVVRAAVMGTFALLARQVGRRQVALNTLALTAALMALHNPLILWDVGFQLSFFATLGILLYAEPLQRWAQRWLTERISPDWAERLTGPISEYVLITIAAQITTLPLLLYHFQRFSFLSLPTNILILPAQPALMIFGGLAVLLALVFFPLGRLLALVAWPFAAYTIRIVEFFARPAWSSLALAPFSLVAVFAAYALIAFLTFRSPSLKLSTLHIRPAAALAILAFLNLWLWGFVLAAPDGVLQLTALNVGDGEALLLRSPTGRNVLINGGSSQVRLAEELGRSLPHSQSELDWLIVGGVGEEHIAALPDSLAYLAPDRLAWFGSLNANYEARRLRAAAAGLDLTIEQPHVGASFDLGGDASLEVLASSNDGAVLLLRMGNCRVLLPIGMADENLHELDWGAALGSVDALLLADGGNPELNPANWLDHLDPGVVLLSLDAASRQGLPDPEVLDALQGRTVLRTDQNGWIRLSTDGQQMWLETGR